MSPARRRWLIGLALTLGLSGLLYAYLAVSLEGRDLAFSLLGRRVRLLDPRGLYGLCLIPLVFWASRWSLSDLSAGRRAFSALLRSLLIALVSLALARPSELGVSTLTSTVFVVDVSDSVDDAALAAVRARVEQAHRARGKHHVALVTFAREARRVELDEQKPVVLARQRDGSATNIQAALSLALGLLAPAHLPQVVLFSDGRETHGELAQAAGMLARHGVTLFAESPAKALPSELAVSDVALPKTLQVGEPFVVRVRTLSTAPRRARLKLYQNGLINGLDGARDVNLEAGETTFEFRSIVRVAGPVSYKAELVPEGGADRFATNNRFERTVLVSGKPRVLYVEGARAQSGEFAELLRAAGFDVEVRGPEGAPGSARELAGFDFYVLSDVPRDALSHAALDGIEQFVENGGGFMMAGGDNSFGLGGYRGSKLETLLPVRLDTERRRDQPTLALLLVIDKSGSMSGEKMELAKEAARATSELLGAEDYLGVTGFDAEPTRVVRLATADNRIGIARGIGRLTAGGGTALFPALDGAYADLAGVRARIKHVILLTDGQTQEEGIPLLVQNMQLDGITVSAIGLGDDVNRRLIEEIARAGGGRSYFTTDPNNVPRLFVRETHAVARSSAVEDYVSARSVSPADFLRSIPIESAPFLRGYVATRARSAPAQVVLASDLGEPLLARMHVGLGWSLAWTSDVKPRWSSEWFRWGPHSAFWAQLVREHMRKQTDEELGIETRLEGDTLVAEIDALDTNERFLNGLSGRLDVQASQTGGLARAVDLTQLAPGRYAARVPLAQPGSYVLQAVLARDGKPQVRASGSFAHPFPAEYAAITPDPGRLALAAAETGGGAVPEGAALFQARGREVTHPVERWPWLLWLALGLFVVDVAARRLGGALWGRRSPQIAADSGPRPAGPRG